MNGRDEYNLRLHQKNDEFIRKHPQLKNFRLFLNAHSETTIYNYLLIVLGFLDHTNKPTFRLTMTDFSEYMNIMKIKSNGEARNNSNLITIYHALNNYGEYLAASKILRTNPMDNVKRPKVKENQRTIEKREKGYLTTEEIQILLNAIHQGVGTHKARQFQNTFKERDLAIVIVFLSTGIRCSALCNLDVNSYDMSHKTLLVTDKGDISKFVTLNDSACHILNEWIKVRKNIMEQLHKQNMALFISRYGDRIDQADVSRMIQKYSSVIEGKHITPHKLRATYGTQLYEATKDIYFVQRAMGHSSPTTTERYIRGQANVTKAASDIMDNILNGENGDN